MRIAMAATLMAVSSAVFGQITVPDPTDGKAVVVFYRGRALSGRTISCAPHEGGAKVSSLPPGTYVAVQAEPGHHEYSVSKVDRGSVAFDVVAGQTMFAECTVGTNGIMTHAHLRVSTREAFMVDAPRLRPIGN